jgi:hypothetical protein
VATLILRYRLKPGVARLAFEQWVAEIDHPKMRGLKRVTSFETYRTTGLLMGEGVPSSDYIELFEIADLNGFTSQDMTGELVQSVMGQFMGFVEEPEFIIAEAIDPQ